MPNIPEFTSAESESGYEWHPDRSESPEPDAEKVKCESCGAWYDETSKCQFSHQHESDDFQNAFYETLLQSGWTPHDADYTVMCMLKDMEASDA